MARVLVVDDSERSRVLVKKLLVELNHEVFLAEESYAAIDLLEKYRFDLVLLDVNMPYQDGFSTLKSLRGRLSFKFLPVVFMSGRKEKRDIERAAQLGAISYFVKPFDPEKFKDKINSILKSHPYRQPLQVNLPEVSQLTQANLEVPTTAKILSISDIGVELLTRLQLLEEQKMPLHSPLFSQIGISPQAMKVMSVQKLDSGLWRAKLLFEHLSVEDTQTLKNWLLSGGLSTGEASLSKSL